MKHLIFVGVSDFILFSALALNLYTALKGRRHLRHLEETRKQLEQFNRDKFPMLVSALERLATAVCPMCALAAGEASVESENDGPMDADPEADGQHTVHVRGGEATCPCRAASIRADARMLFTEGFNEGKSSLITTVIGVK